MKSHTVTFDRNDLIGVIGGTLVLVALLILGIHLAAALHLLPHPLSTDLDRAVLAAKHELSVQPTGAEIVMVGDSSCLSGVDALELKQRLKNETGVINLGMMIWLGLDQYGEATRDYIDANPGRVRLVVLLVTPEKLRSPSLDAQQVELWRTARTGSESGDSSLPTLESVLGIKVVQDCIMAHVIGEPMRRSAGEFYGFKSEFCSFLLDHKGSVVDPGQYSRPRLRNAPKYELAPSFEPESRRFRSVVKAPIKLAIGITPVPEGHAGPEFENQQKLLLKDWNAWVGAEILLTNLPARLPDGLFATGAHLNARGQRRFTRLLATELSKAIP